MRPMIGRSVWCIAKEFHCRDDNDY